MSEEILVNVTPPETRVAIIENGVVQEIIVERTKKRGIVGNIYKGKVCRVLPGMQAAFVDIGLERAAFLHASDIGDNSNGESRVTPINELVTEGSPVMVQVVKDPIGTKGARLTTNLSIPSRFLVFLPGMEPAMGISQKIEDENERQRLRELMQLFAEERGIKGGFIARTAAESADEMALRADMVFLSRLWESMREKMASAKSRELIHEDLPLALRALRDMSDIDVEKIRIDSKTSYEKAVEFTNKFIPEIADRIEYYPGERPIFDIYGVEDEIQKALQRKVDLKSGGHPPSRFGAPARRRMVVTRNSCGAFPTPQNRHMPVKRDAYSSAQPSQLRRPMQGNTIEALRRQLPNSV